jgi:hypothetical protein
MLARRMPAFVRSEIRARFLLRDPRRNRQHQFAGGAKSSEMGFRVRFEFHAVRLQQSHVRERLIHTLARETIERPHQHHIEQLPGRIHHQPLERIAMCMLAGLVVRVLLRDRPLLPSAILAELY